MYWRTRVGTLSFSSLPIDQIATEAWFSLSSTFVRTKLTAARRVDANM